MAGILFNPWTLLDFFETYIFTLVYAANQIIDEIFMVSAFFTYIKLRRMSFGESMLTIVWRYLRMAPLYYMVFVYGWLLTSHFEPNSPWW